MNTKIAKILAGTTPTGSASPSKPCCWAVVMVIIFILGAVVLYRTQSPAPADYAVNVDIEEPGPVAVTNTCRVRLGLGQGSYTDWQTNRTGHFSFPLSRRAWWWGIYAQGTNNYGEPFIWTMQQSNILDDVNIKIILDERRPNAVNK